MRWAVSSRYSRGLSERWCAGSVGEKEAGGVEIVVALNRRRVFGIGIHLDCNRRWARLRFLRETDNGGGAEGLVFSVVTTLRIGGSIPALVMRVVMLVVTDVKVIVNDLTYRAHMYVDVAHPDKLKAGQRHQHNNGVHLRALTRSGPLPTDHRS